MRSNAATVHGRPRPIIPRDNPRADAVDARQSGPAVATLLMRRPLARIPHAEFIVLPEASHSISWEQSEAFNQNVLSLSADIKTQAPEVKSVAASSQASESNW